MHTMVIGFIKSNTRDPFLLAWRSKDTPACFKTLQLIPIGGTVVSQIREIRIITWPYFTGMEEVQGWELLKK